MKDQLIIFINSVAKDIVLQRSLRHHHQNEHAEM
jgi:hypothetical protein